MFLVVFPNPAPRGRDLCDSWMVTQASAIETASNAFAVIAATGTLQFLQPSNHLHHSEKRYRLVGACQRVCRSSHNRESTVLLF